MKEYVIGNTVRTIGQYAFSGCSKVTSFTIPSSVTSIGEYAFSDCSSLTSIVVEEGNSNYDSRDNCNAIIETASNILIAGCKKSTIPDGVTSIGNWAFSGCSGLTSITIPEKVTSIGSDAFSGCTGLKTVTLESKEVVSENRELNSPGLSSVFGNQVQKYVLGDSISVIGDYAFSYCGNLKTIIIPDSIKSIGKGAFNECSSLQYNTSSNVSYLGNTTNRYVVLIKSNSTSTSCSVNAKCKIIYSNAFSGCSTLKSITIPDGVISIGSNAFYGCSNLISVVIPNSVTSAIGEQTFEGCSALTSVSISENVTSIGNRAFYNCGSITALNIPSSVTSIGDLAFGNCQGLKEIWCYVEETPEVASNTFKGVNVGEVLLVVPDNSFDAYKTHEIWGQFWVETPTPIVSPLEETGKSPAIYNLSGQRINKMRKGINIINGKKVVLK